MTQTTDASFAHIWGPCPDGADDATHVAKIDVAGHQFADDYLHLWIDAVDGPRLAKAELTLDAAKELHAQLGREIQLAETHVDLGQAYEGGLFVTRCKCGNASTGEDPSSADAAHLDHVVDAAR